MQLEFSDGSSLDEAGFLARFGARLRTWRRANNIKQSALADMLGVSQPAVVRWEQGRDMPAPARLSQIRDLMAGSMRDELGIQRLFIDRQPGVRIMFEYETVAMLANSQGLRRRLPKTAALINVPLRSHTVNEARMLVENADISHAIRSGKVGLISGVSIRELDFQAETTAKHNWHICFRRYGTRIIGDMVIELLSRDDEQPCGVNDIVYFDHFAEGF
jgi:transcriptional regulator with XRE-family HTH domain